jgi:DNA-binding NtrC family response regulator
VFPNFAAILNSFTPSKAGAYDISGAQRRHNFLEKLGSPMKARRIVIRHPRKKEPVVWIVDSEQWPRACLRAELIERGYDPYGFITINDAFDALSRGASPKPDAVILELRGQDLTRDWISSIRNLSVPTILMGGNTELNEPLMREHRWEMVLKRPFSLGNVADLVEKVLPAAKSR